METVKNEIIFCGCGHGTASHPFKGLSGLRVHQLSTGNCCRRIAIKSEIPSNFRWVSETSLKGTRHEKNTLIQYCDISNQTVSVWTLKNQRGYSYDRKNRIWTLPKLKSSINSLPDNT